MWCELHYLPLDLFQETRKKLCIFQILFSKETQQKKRVNFNLFDKELFPQIKYAMLLFF
jgi:hypothetical protein